MVTCMSSNIRNTKRTALATGTWSEKCAKSASCVASMCCISVSSAWNLTCENHAEQHPMTGRHWIHHELLQPSLRILNHAKNQQSHIARKKLKLSGFMLKGIIKNQTFSLLPSSSAFRSHADVAALLAAPWYLQMCQPKKCYYMLLCRIVLNMSLVFEHTGKVCQIDWPPQTIYIYIWGVVLTQQGATIATKHDTDYT